MSEKKRRKKEGHEKSHEKQAMREGPEMEGRRIHHEERFDTHDPEDIVHYKTGSGSDRNRTGAT